jgi:hypothetical protein
LKKVTKLEARTAEVVAIKTRIEEEPAVETGTAPAEWGGCFSMVHLGASATEADDMNPLPTTKTEGTTSVGEAGAVDVNEESEVPAKVQAMRARSEVGNVDTTEVMFRTSTSIVTGNVGGKSAAEQRKKVCEYMRAAIPCATQELRGLGSGFGCIVI